MSGYSLSGGQTAWRAVFAKAVHEQGIAGQSEAGHFCKS